MLENGATSCWEMWDRHTSHCLGWSAAPAMILPAYVLGVRPVRPGFEAFDVHPRIGSLSWAKGTVPTPRGAINVSWKRGPGRFLITLDVPKGTSARVILPEEIRRACRSLRVDGDKAQARRPVVLAPGRHLVEALAKA